MTKFKRGMLVSLLAPFAFSLGNMAVAACNDCVQIRGETVTLREVVCLAEVRKAPSNLTMRLVGE
jgi:hypothetical protein